MPLNSLLAWKRVTRLHGAVGSSMRTSQSWKVMASSIHIRRGMSASATFVLKSGPRTGAGRLEGSRILVPLLLHDYRSIAHFASLFSTSVARLLRQPPIANVLWISLSKCCLVCLAFSGEFKGGTYRGMTLQRLDYVSQPPTFNWLQSWLRSSWLVPCIPHKAHQLKYCDLTSTFQLPCRQGLNPPDLQRSTPPLRSPTSAYCQDLSRLR